MLFGVRSIKPCATAVKEFLGVMCWTIGVSCLTKCSNMWTLIFLLSSIDFQCYYHWCPMLQPLLCLAMFCDHNLSLICRFNLKF